MLGKALDRALRIELWTTRLRYRNFNCFFVRKSDVLLGDYFCRPREL